MARRTTLTATKISGFTLPEGKTQEFLWDTTAPQLAVRVTNRAKAFIFQSRLADLNKTSFRLTIGACRDWGIDDARKEARRLQTVVDSGGDPRKIKAEAIEKQAEEKKAAITLSEALADYVSRKRRGKDGLPLKDRTKVDYQSLLAAPRPRLRGKGNTLPGPLFSLAHRPINQITGDQIRSAYTAMLKRSQRQASYAAQVLRAVFNWQGIKISGNPFSKDVPGKDRISIPAAKAAGKPIPEERIGAWWQALGRVTNETAKDYLAFLALTGCRPAEPKKILVRDCDMVSGRVIVRDTKNRLDHTILLSRQAAAIVERNIKGKKPTAMLFDIADAKRTINALTKESGTLFQAKTLRSTFASIAGVLCSAYVLKAMMNHAAGADVTAGHYVRIGDADLRAGWQAVANYIDAKAAEALPAVVHDLSAAREAREVAA